LAKRLDSSPPCLHCDKDSVDRLLAAGERRTNQRPVGQLLLPAVERACSPATRPVARTTQNRVGCAGGGGVGRVDRGGHVTSGCLIQVLTREKKRVFGLVRDFWRESITRIPTTQSKDKRSGVNQPGRRSAFSSRCARSPTSFTIQKLQNRRRPFSPAVPSRQFGQLSTPPSRSGQSCRALTTPVARINDRVAMIYILLCVVEKSRLRRRKESRRAPERRTAILATRTKKRRFSRYLPVAGSVELERIQKKNAEKSITTRLTVKSSHLTNGSRHLECRKRKGFPDFSVESRLVPQKRFVLGF